MKKLMSYLSAFLLLLTLSTGVFATVGDVIVDTGITTEVKTLLFEKKLFNGENYNAMDVHVETKNGEVLLTGHVKTEAEKTRAGEIAQSAKGVKSVNNQLTIQP